MVRRGNKPTLTGFVWIFKQIAGIGIKSNPENLRISDPREHRREIRAYVKPVTRHIVNVIGDSRHRDSACYLCDTMTEHLDRDVLSGHPQRIPIDANPLDDITRQIDWCGGMSEYLFPSSAWGPASPVTYIANLCVRRGLHRQCE